MHRYNFLTINSFHEALNKLRAAFLAAKDGNEVEEIIKGILTHDERMKVGRRIQIAQMLRNGFTYAQIREKLNVGPPTIKTVDRKVSENPRCFELIDSREEKIEREYKSKSHDKVGGSKMIYKRRVYTGLKRKDTKR